MEGYKDKQVICTGMGGLEIWKEIPKYEGYYWASNKGRIKSRFKIRVLSPCSGYYRVNLSVNGKKKSWRVSQLIAITFLGHKPNGHLLVVDHINNDKLDDRSENLQIISNRENCSKDKWRCGCASRYPGVSWHKGKWQSRILINGKREYLGRFKKEEDAAKAYFKRLEGHE